MLNKLIPTLLLCLISLNVYAVEIPNLNELTAPQNVDEMYVIDKSDTTDGTSGTGKKIQLRMITTFLEVQDPLMLR